MKKTYKIVSSILVALMILGLSLNSFAAINMDSIKAGDTKSDAQMQKVGSVIISYVTNAAMVISVVMIAILGVKYMIGSAEEKSEYKKSLVPLVIGAVLVFGASAIAKVIVGLAQNFK